MLDLRWQHMLLIILRWWHKLKGTENFTDWDLDLRIILGSEQIEYVLESLLPLAIALDATLEEHETLLKWRDVDRRVKSYILSSLAPELKM